MDKTEVLSRLASDPADLAALEAGAVIALQEKKIDVALTLASRAVRIKPSTNLFRLLAKMAGQLNFARTAAIYLLAAARCEAGGDSERTAAKTDWGLIKARLLEANPGVQDHYNEINSNLETSDQEIELLWRGKSDTERYQDIRKQIEQGQCSLRVSCFYACVLTSLGRYADSLHATTAALMHEDVSLENLINYGATYISWRHQASELAALTQATVNLYPGNASAWANFGGAFDILKRPWECINACNEALKIDPASVSALNNLGNALKNSGQATKAAQSYERALEATNWSQPMLVSNYLLTLQYSADFTAEKKAAQHFKYGELFSPKIEKKSWPSSDGTISVGIVSPDFINHSVSYFLLPLYEGLAAAGIRLVGYNNSTREDHVTEMYKTKAESWHTVRGVDDATLIQQIADDAIDVLIDPSGHTSGNRLPVFASRSAPVQLTWLGHPNTTGLPEMDWRVTDAICDPEGAERLYSEKLYRMPLGNFCVYRPLVARPDQLGHEAFDTKPPPNEGNGYITFGSCNNLGKFSDSVVKTWSEILKKVPSSKLLVEAPGLGQKEFKKFFSDRFKAEGVGPDRLDLRDRDPAKQYVIYHEIDIALDPFPCAGGTTSFDLLWMGVPMVTLHGDAFVGRMGSMLALQLEEPSWVADDLEQYIDIAVALASNPENLRSNRKNQREKMAASPLLDEQQFVAEFLDFLSHRITNASR